MIIQRIIIAIGLLMFNTSQLAAWEINTAGKKGIFVTNSNKHQLSIVENNNGVDFFLSLYKAREIIQPDITDLQIGELGLKTGKLQLIDNYADRKTYILGLDKKQQTTLMNKMISGLEIDVRIVDKNKNRLKTSFSLVGFTARLNDFLIAREIGRLDYEWLLENHRDHELLCYYAANVYVKALMDRLANGTYKKTLESLPKTGIEKLDSVTGEMVQNAYSIPAGKMPRDPRGDKYGIFKACMSQEK